MCHVGALRDLGGDEEPNFRVQGARVRIEDHASEWACGPGRVPVGSVGEVVPEPTAAWSCGLRPDAPGLQVSGQQVLWFPLRYRLAFLASEQEAPQRRPAWVERF